MFNQNGSTIPNLTIPIKHNHTLLSYVYNKIKTYKEWRAYFESLSNDAYFLWWRQTLESTYTLCSASSCSWFNDCTSSQVWTSDCKSTTIDSKTFSEQEMILGTGSTYVLKHYWRSHKNKCHWILVNARSLITASNFLHFIKWIFRKWNTTCFEIKAAEIPDLCDINFPDLLVSNIYFFEKYI